MKEVSKKSGGKVHSKKPPAQVAGVTGIDGHGGMGGAPAEPFQQYVDWNKLTSLPAFEMFVLEESGQSVGPSSDEWVVARRRSMGDDRLYGLYANWHEQKGLWPNETPLGREVLHDS